MSESRNAGKTSISDAHSVKEIATFWEAHSLADCWEQTREAHFDVRAMRRRRVTLDPDVYHQIETLARQRGVLPETLVNLWLSERLQHDPAQTP